jgi:hypothetical protein
MPATQIADVIVPAEFTAYQVENSLEFRRFCRLADSPCLCLADTKSPVLPMPVSRCLIPSVLGPDDLLLFSQ